MAKGRRPKEGPKRQAQARQKRKAVNRSCRDTVIQTVTSPAASSTAVDKLAAVCAAIFILVLAIAAYWDPSIRVLHVFEAIPYGLASVLCLRQRKAGYLLGAASGVFWLWMAGTLTTFV